MFPDTLWPNLLLFLLAQVVVWGCLRTGLVARGVVLLVGTWVLADAALLLRFAFDHTGPGYVGVLLGMQVLTLVELLRFGVGRWRRRRPQRRAQRAAAWEEGMRHWLRDEVDAADAVFGRLVRADPWDLRARLALAQVRVAQDRLRSARRLLFAARHLDRRRQFDDIIRWELSRCGAALPVDDDG